MEKPTLLNHPNPHQPPAQEYCLPVAFDELIDLQDHHVSPWFRRFNNLDSGEVLQLLTTDWADIKEPLARQIADALLLRKPQSIVFDVGDTWLRMDLTDIEDNVLGLRAPKLDATLHKLILPEHLVEDYRSIQKYFSNLSEGIMPYENSLWMSSEPVSEDSCPGCGKWNGSLPIYYICTGDVVLLSKEGKVGRWHHDHEHSNETSRFDDGSCVKPLANSFEDFIELYIDYLSSSLEDRENTALL